MFRENFIFHLHRFLPAFDTSTIARHSCIFSDQTMSYGPGVTQDQASSLAAASTFRDPLVFYDPDLTSGNTQGTDFPFDDLTLPSQSHLPLTDLNASQQNVKKEQFESFSFHRFCAFRTRFSHRMTSME